jgi:hypothetical protein
MMLLGLVFVADGVRGTHGISPTSHVAKPKSHMALTE